MRHLLLLLSCLVLLPACKKSSTTPAGTEVLRWDKSMATRASVPGAKELGARAIKDVKVLVRPDLVGPVTLKLHVETGPVEIVEGKTSRHTSPLAVLVSVDANDDWTITGKCQDGPHYLMGAIGADGAMISPESMVLTCGVRLRYVSTMKDLDSLLNITIRGDGTLGAEMGFGKATIE
jgi:hypothetical protein